MQRKFVILRNLIIATLLGGVLIVASRIYMQVTPTPLNETTELKKLEWQDLIPAAKPLDDALSETPINVRYDLGFISKVLADADAEVISRNGPEYQNAVSLLEKHRANGIDVDSLLTAVSERDQEISRRGEAVDSSLDGKLVQLPGYALPLDMAEQGVTEFLLVPFVGACIHVPPPPPNQIVLAQLETAYKVKDLYDPVLITGHLRAQSASTELYLVDGQAQVPLGYSMQVTDIEPMEE